MYTIYQWLKSYNVFVKTDLILEEKTMMIQLTNRSSLLVLSMLMLLIAVGMFDVQAQNVDSQSGVELPEIRQELLEMYGKDQNVRKVLIEKMKKVGGPMDMEREEFSSERNRLESVTNANSTRLKEIIDQYGWPNPKKVGMQGTKAAFMVLQHANLELQKKMLPKLEKEYEQGKLDGQSLALLTDRVRKKTGQEANLWHTSRF